MNIGYGNTLNTSNGEYDIGNSVTVNNNGTIITR